MYYHTPIYESRITLYRNDSTTVITLVISSLGGDMKKQQPPQNQKAMRDYYIYKENEGLFYDKRVNDIFN